MFAAFLQLSSAALILRALGLSIKQRQLLLLCIPVADFYQILWAWLPLGFSKLSMSRAWVWLVGILAIIGAAQLGQSVTKKSAQALKTRASQRRKDWHTADSNAMPHPNEDALNTEPAAAQADQVYESSSQRDEERIASNGNASTSFPAEPQLSEPLQGNLRESAFKQTH